MNTDSSEGLRVLVRIEGEPAELSRMRSALLEWLSGVGVDEEFSGDLVLAAHELAAEAIERGAAEVAVLGEVIGEAIRLSVVGGDWSSLDELRSTLVRALITEIRIHRGIVTMRSNVTDAGTESAPVAPSERAGRPALGGTLEGR